jgi:hypothetical protein
MTQAEAGIRGSKAVRLYGRLVYELLSGHPPARASAQTYTPLPELDQAGNETLRRACVANGSGATYRNCQEFWNALKENIAAAGRPNSIPVSPQATPPSVLPQAQLAPPPNRRLMVWAILGGALTIALAIFCTIRFGGSGTTSVVTPIPSAASITATPTPGVLVTPTPSVAIATPTAVPTASSSKNFTRRLGEASDDSFPRRVRPLA